MTQSVREVLENWVRPSVLADLIADLQQGSPDNQREVAHGGLLIAAKRALRESQGELGAAGLILAAVAENRGEVFNRTSGS